jgi:hypothetical protein
MKMLCRIALIILVTRSEFALADVRMVITSREGCVTDDLDTILLSPSKFGGGWRQTVQCDLW